MGGACTKNLVDVMDEVESRVAEGTEYRFSLKLATSCGGRRQEKICDNVAVPQPLPHLCQEEGGCLRLTRQEEIACRDIASPQQRGGELQNTVNASKLDNHW